MKNPGYEFVLQMERQGLNITISSICHFYLHRFLSLGSSHWFVVVQIPDILGLLFPGNVAAVFICSFLFARKLFQEFLTPYRNGMSHSSDHVSLITQMLSSGFWINIIYLVGSLPLAI